MFSMNSEYYPVIHILMATFQGGQYLREQLESLETQEYKNWRLTISDDGSTDDTLLIISKFSKKIQQSISILKGPGTGPVDNFFHLLNSVETENSGDLFAFSDQDDIWLSHKLELAASHFKKIGISKLPHLYCGRTRVVDDSLHPLTESDMPCREFRFENALLQNIASGNTMIFNLALLEIIKLISSKNAVWHDWVAYQVATGCGGEVYYEHSSQILYRQHRKNVIGASHDWISKLFNLIETLWQDHRKKMSLIEKAMAEIENHLTPESKNTLNGLKAARRHPNPVKRIIMARRVNLYRQKMIHQILFLLGLFLNRI